MAIQTIIAAKVTGGASVGRFNKSLQGLGLTAGQASGAILALVAAIGIALVSALKDGVTSAIKFRGELAEINTIARLSAKQSGDLSNEILKLSSSLGIAREKVSTSFYNAYSAGAKNAAEATALVTASAELAIAGLGDLEVVTKLVAGTLNAYNLSFSEADRITNSLWLTVEYGLTTLSELQGVFGRVTSTAAAMGIEVEQVSAAFSTLTANGVKTEEAGTAIIGIMNGLIKPTGDLQVVLDQLGITNVKTAIETEGFANVLIKIVKATDGSAQSLGKLFANIRGLRGILSAIVNDDGKKFNEILAAMEERQNALASAFGITTKALQFQFNQAVESIKNAGTEIGDVFAPLVVEVAKILAALAKNIAILFNVIGIQINIVILGFEYLRLGILKVLNAIPGLGGKFDEELEEARKSIDETIARIETLGKRVLGGFGIDVSSPESETEATYKEGTGRNFGSSEADARKLLNESKKARIDEINQILKKDSLIGGIKDKDREILEIKKQILQYEISSGETLGKTAEQIYDSREAFKTAKEAAEQLNEVIDDIAKNITDSLVDGIESGATAFETLRNVAGNVLKDIARQILQSGISNLLGNILTPGSGGGNFLGKILGFHDGGIVPNTSTSIPGRDSVPALLTPGERVIPAGQSAGGNTVYITNRIETVLTDSDYLNLTRKNARQAQAIFTTNEEY